MAAATKAPVVGRALELAEFSSEGFGRRLLWDADGLRVVVAALEDGQQIPIHAPALDLVMTIVEGTGEVVAGGEVRYVRAGDVAVVPAGQARGLRAVGGRLVAVNVVGGRPAEADHEPVGAWTEPQAAPSVGALILEEHAGLFGHLDQLGRLAADSASLPGAELRGRLGAVLTFLKEGLLPHAREEERSVYPAAEAMLRAVGGATRTMSIDHRFIAGMVEEVAEITDKELSAPRRERLRALLSGLEALLRVHFTKENEVYVPLLDRLSPEERRTLNARLGGGDPHSRQEG